MRKLSILAALALAGCGAGHPAVSNSSAGTVTIEQRGGGDKPSADVQSMAAKSCSTTGRPAQLASASKGPDGKTQYLYFCH